MSKDKKSNVVPGGGANAKIASKQSKTMLWIVIGMVVLLGGLSVYMNMPKKDVATGPNGAKVRMQEAVGRTPSDREAFETLNAEVQGMAGAIDNMKDDNREVLGAVRDLTAKIESEDNAQDNYGTELDVMAKRLLAMERRLKDQESRGISTRDVTSPPGASGVRGGPGSFPRSPLTTSGVNTNGASISQGASARRTQMVVSISSEAGANVVEEFEQEINGDLSKAKEPEIFRTADYVPPNAYAPARVYVGVDAATGKQAQADPQAAAFIITGPARHVVIDGEIQETDLEGCIVNGAARGDLSTERVFIKLQKMTCPLGDGRVSVQTVEGHVTQLGKAGVRGVIVSRVGDRINKAAIAGALGGLGNALGGSSRGGVGIGGSGGLIQEVPNAEELAIASLGSGVSNAADILAEYYIDQAKAIQPVVSMPTGVDVELVFINGFKVRPDSEDED